MKIRTLIVDDEPIARRGIRGMLKAQPQAEIIGECGDGIAAVEEIEAKLPDLVFLDIQMPEIDGFGVIETLGLRRMPLFIFITAYDEFALRAFRVHALDYLLKPVKADLFHSAFERARAVLAAQKGEAIEQRLTALVQELRSRQKFAERLVIRSTGSVSLVKTNDVDWLEAEGDYVRLHVHGKKFLHRERISALAARLDPEKFIRLHRSFVVKIDFIKEMQPLTNGDYAVILQNGAKVTMSRTYREKVFQLLETRT